MAMLELMLVLQAGKLVQVICNFTSSHTFELNTLQHQLAQKRLFDDPISYGQKLYQSLFPPASLARQALLAEPDRILLVCPQNDLDTLPWEYLYGPILTDDPNDPDFSENYLVCEYPFVRGLLPELRIVPPGLTNPLHIIAIPSNPLSHEIEPLNIAAEWQRLTEIISEVPHALTLERTWPATLDQTRQLVANKRGRVIHFMGHGDQDPKEALLCFEQENGDLARIKTRDFVHNLRNSVFLVTLNACVSATPGPTSFNNLAASLVRQKVPYALGMRFSVSDEDARSFSRVFYRELASGISVEESLLQARATLVSSRVPWAVGIPVLYTCLSDAASGFPALEGKGEVKKERIKIDVDVLSRAEGTFQGRIDELVELGNSLTGDQRPRLLTIHGGGGQGKTALAREAVERFAFAWPGGVWAISLESLPDKATFVRALARFLDIPTQDVIELEIIERAVLTHLKEKRTLLVLDNAETLVEAAEQKNPAVFPLIEWLKQLPTTVSLFVTSRVLLGWPNGQEAYELDGLSPEEGAALFAQWAPRRLPQRLPQRLSEIDLQLASQLSQKIDGHPLSLQLLGGAFNASSASLEVFISDCEKYLIDAEDKYRGPNHRHYKLYACIETSLRSLDPSLRELLSGLWIFHASFLPETTVTIFDPESEDTEETPSFIHEALRLLWQRSLLRQKFVTISAEETWCFYSILPTTRTYLEYHLAQSYDHNLLLASFGQAYFVTTRWLFAGLDRGGYAAIYAQQAREDLERGMQYVTGLERASYLYLWGWIIYRLSDPLRALSLLDEAVKLVRQGGGQGPELPILNSMALIYSKIGKRKRALEIYEKLLPLVRKGRDRAVEATTLNNMALVYDLMGNRRQALELYKEALPLMRKVGDRAGEAKTLTDMAQHYDWIGNRERALELYEEALSLIRKVGDQAGAAATLNNMALIYSGRGNWNRALELYEEALLLARKVGDQAGEAVTLNNMALVYRGVGNRKRELELYEEALPLIRKVSDRAGEATTLNNMALVSYGIGDQKQALELCEKALLIRREVEDRAGEATTLNNMALIYDGTGDWERALELCKEALLLIREVKDRAGEAITLDNMARILMKMQQYTESAELFQQALAILQEVSNYAGEIASLTEFALLLYHHLARPEEAIRHLERALALFQETKLPQDAAGNTPWQLQATLSEMRNSLSPIANSSVPSTLPHEYVQQLITNAVAVMTNMQERRAGWRNILAELLQKTQQQGPDKQIEVEFFASILSLIDGQPSTLPLNHPYAEALTTIQQKITAYSDLQEPDHLLQDMINFMAVEIWQANHESAELQQNPLFQPKGQTFFEAQIEEARKSEDQHAIQLVELHQALLRACQHVSIAQAFADLEQEMGNEPD